MFYDACEGQVIERAQYESHVSPRGIFHQEKIKASNQHTACVLEMRVGHRATVTAARACLSPLNAVTGAFGNLNFSLVENTSSSVIKIPLTHMAFKLRPFEHVNVQLLGGIGHCGNIPGDPT